MSLAIDVDRVTDVLLADGWHRLDWRVDDQERVSTLTFDAYEYLWHVDRPDPQLIAHGIEGLVPYTGFQFTEGGVSVFGPLTSILAVKTGDEEGTRL